MRSFRAPLLVVLPLLLLHACKRNERPGSSETGGATPSETPTGPVTVEDVQPVIREVGIAGVVPKRLVLEFARAIVDRERVDRPAGGGTVLRIEPETAGTAVFTSPSTLTFTPSDPFAYRTDYVVRLEQVETRSGTIAAPSADAWTYRFRTPAFEFVRLSPKGTGRGGTTQIDLVFSGAVSASAAKRFVELRADGAPILDVKLGPGGEENVLTATIPAHRLAGRKRVTVSIAEGLPAAAKGVVAKASSGQFDHVEGLPVEIKNASLREGQSGFYVEVICDDQAALKKEGGRQRWFWDRESDDGHYLSRRCQLEEEMAATGIRFHPPVEFHVTASGGGFRLLGDFRRGSYVMTVDAGLVSVDGGVLKGAYEKTFTVPARKPQVSFVSAGRYLPRSAWKNLAIRHLNLDTVELTVRHVPPENLVFWMSDDDREATSDRNSDVVLRKTVPLRGEADEPTTTWVDVASMLPRTTKGVLELTVQGGGSRASSRLLLTDISLVAKRGAPTPGVANSETVWVWALSMEEAEPLSGVEVSLVRRSGKSVARCTTAGADGCRLQPASDDPDASAPFALIARQGEDLTYLKYGELKTEVADSAVQGLPYRSDAAYRASVFTDRGVYRPGDVAHLAAIVRSRSDAAPEAGLPVALTLLDPREKVARKLTLKTNEAGLVTVDLPFAAFAETGVYEAKLAVAEKPVGSHRFNVEEFVPERMKVTAATARPGYRVEEPVAVEVEAQYLFGGSAEGSAVELTCRLEPSAFVPKENANYQYGAWRDGNETAKALTLGTQKGTLDENGRASIACPALADAAGFAGSARLQAAVAVFESGSGRSTQQIATSAVHPEAYYLGLLTGATKAKRGAPFKVEGIVVDWNGSPSKEAPPEVEVELARLEAEYGYFWDEEEESERYQRHLRPVVESRRKASVAGSRFSIDVVPDQTSAGYLVRVRAGSARTDLMVAGESDGYWWDPSESRVDQTPRPMRPTHLAVELPKSFKVGESATVKVTAPYRGRMLFTAETDGVVAAEWKKVDAGEVRWSFRPTRFAPNVYVSAFLVKDPHIESRESYLPDRAFGVASAPVEPTEFAQPVALGVPEEVRSNGRLSVELEVGRVDGPTYAVVAAVDEGILSLTRFKSPDPLADLFAKRALGVETFETIGWTMLLPPQGNQRSTGGDDGGSEQAGRVQPVKPVALWSGVVPVSAAGRARVEFDVPQYRGSLRVMAVTVGPRRMGRASANVTVRDPIVLQTTLPRFVAQGDELQIPVFVTNVSGRRLDVVVTMSAENLPVPGMEAPPNPEPPIRMLGKPEGSVSLDDGKSGTLVFQAKAVKSVGAAKFRVTARGGSFESKEELDVPFVPASPRSRIVQRVEVAHGTTDLTPLLGGWLPTTETTNFWLTSNPYGESFDHLRYLVRYPYGCIEQTTSSTRPLLFVSNFLDLSDPTLTQGRKVEEMVMHGIDRLFSMQTPSGGLAYWQGETEPTSWGTAYATHLLLDAQKAGYPVNQDRLNDVLAWIEREVARYENGAPAESGDHGWNSDAEAYLHYDLALAGKGKKGRLLKLIGELPSRLDGETSEKAYLLKAALYLAGDRRYASDLKSPDLSPITDERKNSWSFYSDRRRRGFLLSTFQDLFGDDPAGEPLANMVAASLQGHRSGWYTTQELVWGVTGLGKRVSGHTASFPPGKIVADGKTFSAKAGPKAKSSDRTWTVARASEYRSVRLEMPEKPAGKVFLVVGSEGNRVKPDVKYGGEGLKIRRRYRDLAGNHLGGDRFSLADLVYVEIEIRNTGRERVQNIALVDRLPAGWEIENPRLGRGGAVAWVDADEQWRADFMNVRDDRIELFGALEPGQSRTVVYAARVVTAGRFTIPPVEAEAMYDPTVWAREEGAVIKVDGPWEKFLL